MPGRGSLAAGGNVSGVKIEKFTFDFKVLLNPQVLEYIVLKRFLGRRAPPAAVSRGAPKLLQRAVSPAVSRFVAVLAPAWRGQPRGDVEVAPKRAEKPLRGGMI